ncbi:MAG TPA: TonB-dependent siderophore receptor [Povalibacter sp.]|uniref:TonB-dependent siderophore receptor n=1 Tax=Povalibacter sp. TaxID=1962978 RepID=UPI002CC24012|nr:TonB-dependent siderophore receptor [Povalibacter sp.]HMN43779.1 TonB-dependent siderophore receptor [Povalibacter sp.]
MPTHRGHSRVLKLVVALSLAGLGVPQLAVAQTQAAASRSYSIPAGALGESLNRFASEAGVSLVFEPSEVASLQAPALSGSFTVKEGFARLLSGTGYEAAAESNGSYSLRKMSASSADEATMRTIKVQETLDATTEGTGSYATSAMSTATLLPLTARETPQSVTVITRARIEDQNMIKASDALKYIPGITPHTNSGPNRETYWSRGFEITNFTYDGLPAAYTDSGGHGLLNDMAIYDRVEIVRGATGLSQGTGTPSATINFVRKRPTATFQASVEGIVGEWDYFGATADVSGPLNQAGSVRGRAVASASTADSFQAVVGEDRSVFYAIGEFDLGEHTLLTAAVSYQSNSDISTWAGLPTAQDGGDLNLSRSSFLGNDWNYWDTVNTSAYASINHQFANDWQVVFAANYIDVEQEHFVNGLYLNEAGGYNLSGHYADEGNERTSFDLRAQGPFELFGRQHDVVVGAAVREAEDDGTVAGYGGFIVASDIDIYNWTHDAVKPDPRDLIDFYYAGKTRERGIYTSARFNISDPLKLIVGARVDWFEYEFQGDYYNIWVTPPEQPFWDGWTEAYDYDKHVTKYAGVTYDLAGQATVYASYTDIFQPQSAMDRNGEFIDPIVGKNYEVGVKSAWADGLLELDAAVFRIDQDNIAVSDLAACPPPGQGCSRPGGLIRSEGFDIELLGRLTPSWEIAAGYTYANPKTIENADDPSAEGQDIDPNLPRRLLKATTTYRLPGGKWRVGGGFRWQSDVDHFNDWMGYDYRTEQKAYTLVDAMVSYEHNANFSVQLNVTNLFDETYWRVINTQPVEWGGNALYGEPRRVMVTARSRF